MRVAAVQDNPVLLDRESCLEQVAELTRSAAEQGAQLVVFPEAFVPGPPREAAATHHARPPR